MSVTAELLKYHESYVADFDRRPLPLPAARKSAVVGTPREVSW